MFDILPFYSEVIYKLLLIATSTRLQQSLNEIQDHIFATEKKSTDLSIEVKQVWVQFFLCFLFIL
jgi:hypothetical protein